MQRVPETESQGRVHTSACTVAILPEVDAVDSIEIQTADLRIDTFRASGAGGQHVNKTDIYKKNHRKFFKGQSYWGVVDQVCKSIGFSFFVSFLLIFLFFVENVIFPCFFFRFFLNFSCFLIFS